MGRITDPVGKSKNARQGADCGSRRGGRSQRAAKSSVASRSPGSSSARRRSAARGCCPARSTAAAPLCPAVTRHRYAPFAGSQQRVGALASEGAAEDVRDQAEPLQNARRPVNDPRGSETDGAFDRAVDDKRKRHARVGPIAAKARALDGIGNVLDRVHADHPAGEHLRHRPGELLGRGPASSSACDCSPIGSDS